ncbi:hypothetical protein GQ44DRAFT_770104 [Phaeosphaeriaceae sp. PMI808]|nr:hypothetical protein GQ44DRAFT_770104 [Phaeosphaeriaceae sp. PMI808]
MPARKRARDEMEADEVVEEPSTLQKLRNMWQFANLAQYISLFGDAIKIDRDFDIEELETECLKPHPSEKLAQVGLALLKHVSSHKGLTLDIFDEYTRRQFVAKAPNRNPFGTEEDPNRFHDFDVYTKIRVLQQLSIWTLNNPNSIRERLSATDGEQTLWRMEPTGWDSADRTLFVLDDNRMYRRTDPPPPPEPKKAKAKPKSKKSRGTRASKRQKVSTPESEEPPEEDEMQVDEQSEEVEDESFGGMKWECICVTLEDYQEYMAGIRKSRDPNEKILYKRLEEEVMPVMENLAEEQARKQARKMRELENMQKLAMAKRSSRISSRLEKQKEQDEVETAERRRQAELASAKAEQEKQRKLEEAHDSRRMTREQRLRERETAKILKEDELRKLKDNEQKLATNVARLSERHLKAMMKQHENDLRRLNEEEDWFFDCEKCGTYGSNLNDNTPQISCEKCTVWQHVKCHNITEDQVDNPNFQFICGTCKRKEQETTQPKLPSLKLRLTSASPASRNEANANEVQPVQPPTPTRHLESVRIPALQPHRTQNYQQPVQPMQPWVDGPSLSPRGQALGPPGIHRSEAAYGSPYHGTNGSSSPVRARPASSGQPTASFSSRGDFPTSSPPPFNLFQAPSSPIKGQHMSSPVKSQHMSSPAKTHNISSRPQNGSFSLANPFTSSQRIPPYVQSFNRPTSSASHTAPAPLRIAPSPSSQMPAQILPDPIPAPSKHDAIRPVSSHEMSETSIFPPAQALSPAHKPLILSPPVKKSSPGPERKNGVSAAQNGF